LSVTEASPDAGTSPRLLIVDDEPLIARGIRRGLRGYEVVIEERAMSALVRLECREPFTWILSDIMMPHMDGVAFYEQVAAVAPAYARRVLFMTGGATDPDADRFLARMIGRVLQKPFSITELVKILETRGLALRDEP
jgi:two-component system cell cycle response regulator CpdR